MTDITSSLPIRARVVVVKSDPETFSRLFHDGEITTGKVISQIDPNHVILRFKGHNLVAETTLPLVEQEERRFLIEATSPQVTLRLLSEGIRGDSPAGWLKRYLACDIPGRDLTEELSPLWETQTGSLSPTVRDTVERLLTLLKAFNTDQLAGGPDALRDLIERSGLFFENRLAREAATDLKAAIRKDDLKALLLELKQNLNSSFDGNHSVIDQLSKGVDHCIKKIELFQLLNLAQSGPEEKIFLLLPFWFSDHPRFLELNISLPRKGSTSEPEGEKLSVLFLLDLPHLGRMRIDVRIKGKGLYCLFEVYDPQAASVVEPLLPELRNRLVGLGFDPYLHVSTETPRETVSLIGEVGEDLKSLLSVIV